MRRLLVLLALTGTTLLALGSAANAQTYPPAGLRVVAGRVSPHSVPSGGTVEFAGGGFRPHASVVLTLNGVPAGSVHAGANGAFEVSLVLHGNGVEALAGSGMEPSGRLRVVTGQLTLLSADRPDPPTNGGSPLLDLLLGFLVVLVGAGVTLWRRVRGARG